MKSINYKLFLAFPAGLIGFMFLLLSASGALAQTTNTWTGQTGSDWNTAANWSRTAVPGTGDDVVIPAGTTNAPILSTTAVAKSVEVQSGASLTISNSGSLSINGSKSYSGATRGFSNSGLVRNEGQLVLGNMGSSGEVGLYNTASFSNATGGIIHIDGFSGSGLSTAGSFVNSATIAIGSKVATGFSGLDNYSSFTNTAGSVIQIDRVTGSGLRNNSGSFVNSATVTIGSIASTGSYGLQNQSSFTNTAGGSIQIDKTSLNGLYNSSGSFVNEATVTIGSSVTGTAISNSGSINNQGCQALINSLGNATISNAASFSNTGTLIERSSGNSSISYNGGLVQNLNGGTFTITDNQGLLTTATDQFWRGCVSSDWNTPANWSGGTVPTATDDVTIPAGTAYSPVLSTTAVAHSVEVQSGASLTISTTGSLSINGFKYLSGPRPSSGFYNSGQVRNEGQLILGNTGPVGICGLYNESSFTNTAAGSIQIDRADNYALGNNMNGSFVNSATIIIGSGADAGGIGLYNTASFTNTAAGSIQIDRTSSFGLSNEVNGSFVNSAVIVIGSGADAGGIGLYNTASFTNTAAGSIQIDRTSSRGLYNSGSFVNSATINIGTTASGVAIDTGLYTSSSFSNLTGGNITIDRTTAVGLNTSNNFVNQATITIGASVTGNAISNSGLINNQGCQALINSLGNAYITNFSSFSNTGTLIERSANYSSISYNGGLVQDLNGGTFIITNNQGLLTTATGQFWRGCVSSNWNTPANWSAGTVPTATDDVTIPAGTAYSPVLSTTAVAKSVEVQTGASLTISTTGSLSINGSKSYIGSTRGFSNNGLVRNEGQLVLGSTGSVGDFGLYNTTSFSNATGGILQIDGFSGAGLYTTGTFVNSATIAIGSIGTTGYFGLDNYSTFTNTAGGFIQIEGFTDSGLRNGSGSFVNSATITIGSIASTQGPFGIQNRASFTSTTGALIQIDKTSSCGMLCLAGSFINSATIKIGSIASIGSYGIRNLASFTNTAGGIIQIDRSATDGLANNANTFFINSATITIGASATGNAISTDGAFNNQGCQALINSLGDAVISGSSSLSNTGTIIERSSGNSSISYNGGLVQNLNGGTFAIATGQPPLSVSAIDLTTCNPANGSLTIAG
ncbi:beta strand repeat-containing protein, partial [Arsenicibacter rosenii]|uniref:beta strand repeat-containing protein n=1 Tax=Arsenicibacter rosenii TaxID=1750698 RepID=UPI00116071F7